jgi:hypothetical protein
MNKQDIFQNVDFDGFQKHSFFAVTHKDASYLQHAALTEKIASVSDFQKGTNLSKAAADISF